MNKEREEGKRYPSDDPLGPEAEAELNEAQRQAVERAMIAKRQAEQVLAMTELMDEFRRGQRLAEETRDTTYGDEHFVWVGRCIQVRELFVALEKAAAYQPPREKKKNASSYC